MPSIDQERILAQAKKLAETIAEQEEVQLFQQAERQILYHRRVQELIRMIKMKQQELVNAKHIKKPNYIKQIEDELDILNQELHAIPLVHQFQQSQDEVNETFQLIIQIIKKQISKHIPVEKGNI